MVQANPAPYIIVNYSFLKHSKQPSKYLSIFFEVLWCILGISILPENLTQRIHF